MFFYNQEFEYEKVSKLNLNKDMSYPAVYHIYEFRKLP